jgi:crotonobetainyl-CoA:carnitine CoA-transferase CaiB-like acyl-CoA transferase
MLLGDLGADVAKVEALKAIRSARRAALLQG